MRSREWLGWRLCGARVPYLTARGRNGREGSIFLAPARRPIGTVHLVDSR